MVMSEIISDSTFEDAVLKADKPVLVDFFAPWCGPCRAMSPVIDEIAGEAEGKYLVFKMNVDESPRTAAKYGIRSIPTLIAFKNGNAETTLNGAHPKDKILAMMDALA